ncbi:Cytosolic sulfotransferase 15, partial [Mucuna pruriens]
MFCGDIHEIPHLSNMTGPRLFSSPPLTIEEAFKSYFREIIGFGLSWNHMQESVARPNKIIFLKYENLKDVNFNVKRIAVFLDCPWSMTPY